MSTRFLKPFAYISRKLTAVSLSSQLTVEKLCKLTPLHSGLSPDVIADLHWSGISEDALCQCWRTLITDLKPGQRSWLFDATQEVMPPAFNASDLTVAFFPNLPITLVLSQFAFPFGLQSKRFDDSPWKNALPDFIRPPDERDLPDISVVRQQLLHRNLHNITQEVKCLLPFVPLKTLTEILDGEAMLGKIRPIGSILWSPQQVCVLYLYLHVWSGIRLSTDGGVFCKE